MADLSFLANQVQELKEQGLFNTIRTIGSPQGAWFEVDGRKCLNFCSNNYLGLANDPRLRKAATEAIEQFGVGPGAVRTIAGTNQLHAELEKKLAEFKGVEATLSLQSGWCANEAVIPAITGPEDAIFSDELNHASIIDGCRLSKAKRYRYSHCDADDLAKQLEANSGYRRAVVITDGVFSMDGDIAPLDKLTEITGRYDNVLLMVDDAHGEGVLGRGGRGAADHFGLHNGEVDIEIGTMSKAFGVVGGYVAGKQPLIDWLRQRARPLLFSSAVTPPDAAACIRSVEILAASTELVDRLWENGRGFQKSMREAGFNTGVTQTPITPVMIGDEKTTQDFSRRLYEEESIFASPIAYPTVPKGKARIRVMVSAAHSEEDLQRGVEAFTRVGRSLGVI